MLPTLQFPHLSDRARAMWLSCLASAFRTALACTIVGCASLYGPASLRRQIEFPAFSYATVIIIINGATLGDTVRACWQAAYATVLGVCPAILSLWVIGPTRLSIGNMAAAVALSAFVVGLPEWSGLVVERIALGQIVIVYLLALLKGGETDAVMHPVHVAASTAVGVLACVLALLFPYPRLASYEVPTLNLKWISYSTFHSLFFFFFSLFNYAGNPITASNKTHLIKFYTNYEPILFP